MKIYLGPGGVPSVSKDRSTLGGIQTVAELKLNAMECEFVRGVKMKPELAEQVGRLASELGIRLSVHAPYFINLCSTYKKIVEASKQMILDSADRAERMNADAVAIHVAYYSGLTPEQAYQTVKENFLDILDKMKQQGIKNVKLGIETMGKETQFGSLDEAIKLSKEIKDLIPYVDFSHLLVRQKGKIDYSEIFDKLEVLKLKHVNCHFQNVKKNKQGNFVDVHMPLDSNPPFEPLAKEVLKRKLDITIISESPILEQDSLKMKQKFERLGYKF